VIIDCALKQGIEIDINSYDNRGRTALIYSVIQENEDILKLIMKYNQGCKSKLQIKWRDELGKDVCDYAETLNMKKILVKYIEDNEIEYHDY
jgi:ankyrin repeat protein